MSQSSDIQFNDGAAYERLMGRWSRKVGREFLRWCNVPAGGRWLDVGCGNGAFTEEIVAHAQPSAVQGIDPSPAQIDYARKRTGTAMARLDVGDAQALPYGNAEYDAAVMALVIAFVPDPAKGVAELVRVLKPGGLAATYMWDIPAGGVPTAPFYRTLKQMGMDAAQPPSAEISAREPLERLWREAGLADVEMTEFRITVHFIDFEDFWQANTLPVGPQAARIKALAPEQVDELKRRLREQLKPAADGSISYEAVANAVKGRKRG